MMRKVYKTESGYTDNGSLFGCCMYWDEYGTYIGQEQLNCMDDDPGAPAFLFFKAQGNEEPVLFSLKEEEMRCAAQT